MVQVPALTSVTSEPETVHTAAVVELNVTGKPDELVADTLNGAEPNVIPAIGEKLMV